MLRRLTAAVALTCLLSVFSAPVAESDPARSAPMQFTLHQASPAACGKDCRTWISATGMIRAETAREFESFAARHDLRGATLVLNSEGGSVHGALALGRAIRRLGLATTVGRTVPPSQKTGGQPAVLPRADCESMCAFVLLAGTSRNVPEEARVRVHQIWLGDRRDDAAAATYSAEDLALVQRDIGKLAQYTVEMGGTIELLEIALRIPPWEPMRALTRAEIRRMRLDTGETPAASDPPVASHSAPLTTGSVRRMSTRGGELGWIMGERDGRIMLMRRHPLTIEGEEIGSFDVSIACGDKPSEYALVYREVRRASESGGAAQLLKDVQLRFGYRTIPLTLTQSELTASSERVSTASGILTATTLSSFAGSTNRSLTFETTTADRVATSIRIGNTSAAQHFPQLAAACAQSRVEHAGLQPGR
jgi:hypothetical protein